MSRPWARGQHSTSTTEYICIAWQWPSRTNPCWCPCTHIHSHQHTHIHTHTHTYTHIHICIHIHIYIYIAISNNNLRPSLTPTKLIFLLFNSKHTQSHHSRRLINFTYVLVHTFSHLPFCTLSYPFSTHFLTPLKRVVHFLLFIIKSTNEISGLGENSTCFGLRLLALRMLWVFTWKFAVYLWLTLCYTALVHPFHQGLLQQQDVHPTT